LGFREIESFLRDQNDSSAFPQNSEKIYDQLIYDLTALYFIYRHCESLYPKTFVGENRFWLHLLAPFESIEFILKDKDTLYFLNKGTGRVVSFVISD
jgi:hypothetical protein